MGTRLALFLALACSPAAHQPDGRGVARGENGGRTLENDFVVRRLERALWLEPGDRARRQRTLTLKVDPGWKAETLGLAAFVQDPASMKIHGGAALAALQ